MIVWLRKALLVLALLFFSPGLFFGVLQPLPPAWAWLHAAVIALYATILLLWLIESANGPAGLIPALLIMPAAIGLEAFGVAFGFPFGEYQYTAVLGKQVLDVPWMIAPAWFAVLISAAGTARALSRGRASGWRLSLAASLLVLALDVVLEPAASRFFGFWLWQGQKIPLANYISWFTASFILCGAFTLAGDTGASPGKAVAATPVTIYVLLWTFFAAADTVQGFFPAVAASAVLLLANAVFTQTLRPWN